MKNEFLRIAFSQITRTNEVYRYSGTYQVNQESLSEHITDVSIMSYLIGNKIISLGEDIDIGVLLEKCLVHDLDEVVTGDVPRNTKYATIDVHNSMDIVANRAIESLANSTNVGRRLIGTWRNSKVGPEGIILKLSDMLCVARKAIIEVNLYGNKSFLRVVEEVDTHLNYLANSDYQEVFSSADAIDYLKNLVREAQMEIHHIYEDNYTEICKYHIGENILEAAEYNEHDQ